FCDGDGGQGGFDAELGFFRDQGMLTLDGGVQGFDTGLVPLKGLGLFISQVASPDPSGHGPL
uniref:hypothetical protein n=1 Tax=Ferrovum sp. TaxID=2609467 RepID=UPI00262E7C12